MNKIALLCMACLVFACNNSQESPKDLQARIAKLEAEGTNKPGVAKLYLEHYRKFPEDTLNAKYVTKLANYYIQETNQIDSGLHYTSIVFNKYPKSNIASAAMLIYAKSQSQLSEKIHWYRQTGIKYPNSKAAEDAMISIAVDYENAQMKEEALTGYGEYLATYPKGFYAADAEASIKNIDKSAEELIKEFEEQNKRKPQE